jgi:hypothetical protein
MLNHASPQNKEELAIAASRGGAQAAFPENTGVFKKDGRRFKVDWTK